MTRLEIMAAIQKERERQGEKWGRAHAWGWGDCSSPSVPEPVKAAVLAGETGEVASALLKGDRNNLRDELVQVAAVCVAWLESL